MWVALKASQMVALLDWKTVESRADKTVVQKVKLKELQLAEWKVAQKDDSTGHLLVVNLVEQMEG